MEQSAIVSAFLNLRSTLILAIEEPHSDEAGRLNDVITRAHSANSWFTSQHIIHALKSLTVMLSELERPYKKSAIPYSGNPKTVALIMAGNIPLVGFQDLLHVLLSGHRALCKLSDDDKVLMPYIADILTTHTPELKEYIRFSEATVKDFDAVIATGSNNTARYFEYYFGKYPHIIRKNRNSVAVLTGNESAEELTLLADDIFMYFGLGCRNVSALLLPEGFDMGSLINACQKYSGLGNHTKYMNNYEYYRAIHMVNNTPFIDGGFFILLETDIVSSPPGIIHYQKYGSMEQAVQRISAMNEQLQCIISAEDTIKGSIPPGSSQQPGLFDFADGVNTFEFLGAL